MGKEGPSASVTASCCGGSGGAAEGPQHRTGTGRSPAGNPHCLPCVVTQHPFAVRLLAAVCLRARRNLSWTVMFPEGDVELAEQEKLRERLLDECI